MDEIAEEICFIAEHPKADMSKVDVIRVNGKEYVSLERVIEIIDEAIWLYSGDKVSLRRLIRGIGR